MAEIDDKALRLRQLVDDSGLSQSEFSKRVGMNKANISMVLSGKRACGELMLKKIHNALPGTNIKWLIFGTGKMYEDGHDKRTVFYGSEPTSTIEIVPAQPTSKKGEIKRMEGMATVVYLVPTTARGGSLAEYSAGVMEWECEKVTSPVKSADLCIVVSGESMQPMIPHGSRLFIQKINEEAFIEWGKPYVLDTENGAVVKILTKSENEGYITCVSVNPDPLYKPFEVPTDSIRGYYRILACLLPM